VREELIGIGDDGGSGGVEVRMYKGIG